MIELESACVTVATADGHAMILEPTTLRLAEQRISIIGGNGSGKSTLARLLNGLIVPTSGTVRVLAGNDQMPGLIARVQSATDARTAAPREVDDTPANWVDTSRHGAQVRRAVGFVFTDPAAQLVMPTAIEDIALSLRRTHPKKPDRLAAAHEALAEFGLGHLADRSVHTLSGGQKQLLAIAAVLATRPQILVADEPTTLLDLRNSLRIRELLMSLPQQVILVTHDLELAAQADRTLVVEDARVVFDGSPAEAIDFYRQSASTEESGQARPPEIELAPEPEPRAEE